MRKFIKENILEILKTIYEVHKVIKNLIKVKNIDDAKSVLVDCQETIFQVGEIIENSEKEDIKTIELISEYYKYIYKIYTSISEDSKGKEIKNNLDNRLYKIEKSIKEDIKANLEIVFMPYKASMWDSLESIWQSADKDPDCNAYVVPIPYYDRNPDHSLGEFHYEGNQYPDYVPITHYNAYNLATHKPDIIYIHNPYDDCNYVTSVDPRFYSYNLKKYTNCLIYVPYFVVANEKVNESILINSACRFADYVILQSIPLKNKHINLYSSILDKDKNELEKKFLALGSPKFDAILNSRKKDFFIPESWQSLINNKKIVLYNTSISTTLMDTEKFLFKLSSTIQFFTDNPEYVLWWRPHPLLNSTFESMRPDLLSEYKRIVSDYISNNKGIYDDSADLQRAIILSNLYYGDFKSSICVLYAATGKKIVSAHIESNEKITSFTQDMKEHLIDNISLDILKRNENYDGTAGWHIHDYIKLEFLKNGIN